MFMYQGEIEGSKLYQDLLKKAKQQFSENFMTQNRFVQQIHGSIASTRRGKVFGMKNPQTLQRSIVTWRQKKQDI